MVDAECGDDSRRELLLEQYARTQKYSETWSRCLIKCNVMFYSKQFLAETLELSELVWFEYDFHRNDLLSKSDTD